MNTRTSPLEVVVAMRPVVTVVLVVVVIVVP